MKKRKEILKLEDLLIKAKIEYKKIEFKTGVDYLNGWILHVSNGEGKLLSFAQHGGTYGHEINTIEWWEADSGKDPQGWKTAEECLEKAKEWTNGTTR